MDFPVEAIIKVHTGIFLQPVTNQSTLCPEVRRPVI
jgi:hypothetical protein